MTAIDLGYVVQLAFLIGAAFFALGLHQMNSPATARRGNRLSATGMTIAVVAELIYVGYRGVEPGNWVIIGGGMVGGGAIGLRMARTVAMTSMALGPNSGTTARS